MMDREYFTDAGMPPPQPLQFEAMVWNGEQSFMEPTSSIDQYSALSSMVSSPVVPTSNEALVLHELIGKLGGFGGGGAAFHSPVAGGSPFSNDSCYGSPPKLQLPILNHMNMIINNNNNNNNNNLGNSMAPSLPSLAADPGFAERAAKFSCFGSRSFNGRTSPSGLHNPHRSGATPLMGHGKLPRVSSTPSLKHPTAEIKILSQAQMEMRPCNGILSNSDKKMSKLSGNSNEESSVSEQIQSGETGSKISNEMSSRKRKGVCRGKPKEDAPKSAKGDEQGNSKRCKQNETEKNEMKTEEDEKFKDENEKQKANNQKPPEPPKDYIHVRARRGQATDSHSLAERVRREKISERMKLLQDLVPGCNKVTGKALMLDEIINYVQSLQRQVEFLSMKLASVNPGLDFNMNTLLSNSKDIFQQNAAAQPQQLYPLDSSTPTPFFTHNQNVQLQNATNACRGPLSPTTVDPIHLQLPCVDGFGENLPQFPSFGEDDLNSIVQMGFGQNLVNFPVPNQTSDMKIER